MRLAGFMAGLVLAMAAPASAIAGLPATGPAAGLTAALGGTLDSDIGEAGALSRPVDYSAIRLIPGRAIEYRRRVALESRLAETSPGSRSRETAMR
jgi:hypothetical protein